MKSGTIKSDLRLVWQMYRRHFGIIVRILLLLLVLAGCNVILPQLTASIIDDGLITGDTNATLRLALSLFGIAMLIAAIYLRCEHLRLTSYNRVMQELRHQALDKLLKVRIDFYNTKSSAELFAQLDEDIEAVSGCFRTEILMALMQVFTTIGLLPSLCAVSWQLTVCMLLFLPFKLIKTLLLSRHEYRNAKRMIHAKKEYSKWLAEVVCGMPIIRIFGVQKHFEKTFFEKQAVVAQTQYRHEMLQEYDAQSENAFCSLLESLCYIIACYLIAGHTVTLGAFVSFQCYSGILIGFVSQLLGIIFRFSAVMPSFERFVELLAEPEETQAGTDDPPANHDIDLHHVDFSYADGQPVLHDFSLRIPQGSHVALVGPNGCGKSTVFSLLLRLCEPDAGSITLGGRAIQSIPLKTYRSLFAVTPQKPYFFCDSIRNNLTMFRDVAPEQLESVIHCIGLEELVREKGWDYCVGQDGCELSGGQRQLLGLGRALLTDAPIILLDETEANVDQAYEGILMRLMQERFAGITVVMITHRKELLAHMDRVISMADETKQACTA